MDRVALTARSFLAQRTRVLERTTPIAMKRARKTLVSPSEACARIIIHSPYEHLTPPHAAVFAVFPLSTILAEWRQMSAKRRRSTGESPSPFGVA
jgi:hypothetical protein